MRALVVSVLFFLLLGLPSISLAASLSVSPASGTYSVGDQIAVKVLVSSSDASLNAVSAALSFSPAIFSIQSVSKINSILNFWVTNPTFSSRTGTAEFEGVSLAGFQGHDGTVVTVTLRALKAGSGIVSFQSGHVLANDGQGTDITSGLSGGTFKIEAAKAKPSPIPSVIPAEEMQPGASAIPVLTAPVISLGEKNSLPAILGTSAYPNANLLLTFIPDSGSKIFITDVTNDDGSFILPVPQALRNGSYEISAVVVLHDGTQSLSSNVLTVEVGSLFVGDISWENATYMSLFLVILLITLIGYFMSRRHFGLQKNTPLSIKKEIKKAEDALHKSFWLLEQDIILHMKTRTMEGKIDRKERQEIEGLRKDLKEAESYIDKEIQHINEKEY